MRRVLAVACSGLLLFALAACDPPPLPVLPTPSTSTSASAPSRASDRLPTEGEVRSALVSAEELPGGTFTVSPIQQGGAADLGDGIRGCSGNATPGDETVEARNVFQVSLAGPYVVEALAVTSLAEALRHMHALDDVVANCAHFGGTAGGGLQIDVSIGPLTMPQMGDEMRAFRMTSSIEGAGVGVYAHVVTCRTSNVLVTIILMGLDSPDAALTEAIMQLALAKSASLRAA